MSYPFLFQPPRGQLRRGCFATWRAGDAVLAQYAVSDVLQLCHNSDPRVLAPLNEIHLAVHWPPLSECILWQLYMQVTRHLQRIENTVFTSGTPCGMLSKMTDVQRTCHGEPRAAWERTISQRQKRGEYKTTAKVKRPRCFLDGHSDLRPSCTFQWQAAGSSISAPGVVSQKKAGAGPSDPGWKGRKCVVGKGRFEAHTHL